MKKPGFSVEVFPPKTNDGIEVIYRPLDGIAALSPDYISVTYSAGGSAKGLTLEVCEFIKKVHGIESVAHLTCANSSASYIDDYLDKLHYAGIDYVLALRGDLADENQLSDYRYASDLIRDIKNKGAQHIFAACYPEGHKDSPSFDMDIRVMKLKEDLGAEHFISQLFFDEADFFRMTEKARSQGVKSDIVAGIMPVTNAKQIVRMVQLSGAKIPENLSRLIAKYEYDPKGLYEAGIEFSVNQSVKLLEGGADGLHLYAMNNALVAEKYYEGVRVSLGR